MSILVDTSILIDVLRGDRSAAGFLRNARTDGQLHVSELTILEVLAGTRPHEEAATRGLLNVLVWHPVDETVAEVAGELGRKWLSGNRGIDSADLAIGATATVLGIPLATKNVKHFPMFPGLVAPY